jgi:hypothetical protein
MERDRVGRYVKSLEQTIKNNYLFLKKAVDDFREMCRIVAPERSTPQGIIVDIREMYKEIRTRLTEIKAIQQLLQGKYRQYYRRDSLMDKDILEFGFTAKNCYSKVEYVLKQKQAQEKIRTEEGESISPPEGRNASFKWFHSRENQIALTKNLRILKELDYENVSELENAEKRDLSGERSLTLLIFRAEPSTLHQFLSRVHFREHDVIERYRPDELRGALMHLRKVSPVEMEQVFQRFMKEKGFSNMKGLLLPVSSSKDLESDRFKSLDATLDEMQEGEVKTLLD